MSSPVRIPPSIEDIFYKKNFIADLASVSHDQNFEQVPDTPNPPCKMEKNYTYSFLLKLKITKKMFGLRVEIGKLKTKNVMKLMSHINNFGSCKTNCKMKIVVMRSHDIILKCITLITFGSCKTNCKMKIVVMRSHDVILKCKM